MTLAAPPHTPVNLDTLADLIDRLGGVAPSRILMRPPPGTATDDDLLRANALRGRVFELVEGVLVEKAMGYRESLLAAFLIEVLGLFVRRANLGLVTAPDGIVRLLPGVTRAPDVAFVSWARLPGGRVPDAAVPEVVPDLAVEVISEGNTEGEMARKRREYFDAGVTLVWSVDPRRREVRVFTSPAQSTVVDQTGVLDGGDMLPGFRLSVHEWFAELDRRGPARA